MPLIVWAKRLALQDGRLQDRLVSRLVQHVRDGAEELVHGAAQVRAAIEPADDIFQLGVGRLQGIGAGLIGVGALELALEKGVDLLGDGLDLNAGALDQRAVGLAGAGDEVGGFAEIARGIGIGNILPHHLQGDIVCLQGSGGHLDGTGERHSRLPSRFLIEQHAAGSRGSSFSICRLNPAASRNNL